MITTRTAVSSAISIANRPPFYDAGLGPYVAQPAFSPLALFSSGEQGWLYDAAPNDFSGLFQDSAGTTPVTAVEQPVGRMLDTSGRGNHATQTTSGARPTLSARYNLLLATASLSTQSVTTAAATYTLSFSGAGSVTLTGTALGVYTAGTHSISCATGSLTLTVLGAVANADLRPSNDGVGLPAYQDVIDATNYDTVGFPLYLRFDGSADFLVTAAINLSGTDKTSHFMASRKLSDAGAVVALNFLGDYVNVNGAFIVGSSNTNGTDRFSWTHSFRGSVSQNQRQSRSFPAPISGVLSATFNAAGAGFAGQLAPRVNGATPPTIVDAAGPTSAGNFGNGNLWIGCYSGVALFYPGRIYFPIVSVGRLATSVEITNMETLLNARNKVY